MGGQTTNHAEYIQATPTFSEYTCYRRGCANNGNGFCRRCNRNIGEFLSQTKSKPKQ